MSWFTQVVVVAAFVISAYAGAARTVFTSGEKAEVETKKIEKRGELSSYEFHLQVPSIDIEPADDGFSVLSVEGLTPQKVAGNPGIFVTGKLIAVPNGFEPVLEVRDVRNQTLKGVRIQPAQKKFRCSTGREEFKFNSTLYASDKMYPESVVTLEEVGKIQDLRFFRVGFQPVQVDFANESLQVTTDLNVSVSFRKTGRAEKMALPRSIRRMALASAANGADLTTQVTENRGPEVMVVIVADSLKSALMPYVQWKQSKGMQLQVYTATEAGNTKENIQAFVQKIYDSAVVKPTYLLSVGNATTVPAFKETTSAGAAISDYRYTLLSGSDELPDLFYGRFLADNEVDLTTQIARTIAYEKAPNKENWFNNATTIASNEGSNPSDKDYAMQIQGNLGANTYKQFDSFFQADGNATVTNITNAISQGRTWLAYFGHGSGTSWGSTNEDFSNTQVAGLSNSTGKLPFLIDVACLNASWEKVSKCFGKAWVTQQVDGMPAGAVAFYGGSVSISWDPPAVMSVGISKTHFEKKLSTLGASVLAGQMYLIEKMGTGSDTLENLKWYNLLGDPALSMRTDHPKQFQVKHNLVRENGRSVLKVTATDLNNAPVPNLLAAVYFENNSVLLGMGKTEMDGVAQIDLGSISTFEPNTVLTMTGYNMDTVVTTLK